MVSFLAESSRSFWSTVATTLLLATFAAGVNAEVRQKTGGVAGNSFIVGGQAVDINLYPYVSYLVSAKTSPTTGKVLTSSSCTGSLIQNAPVPVILTAGHCGNPNDGNNIRRAFVGAATMLTSCLNQPTCRQMNVTKVIVNPNFTGLLPGNNGVDVTGNDAALWVLAPLNETRPITDIPPVPMNTDPAIPAVGDFSNAIGWGLTNVGGITGNQTTPDTLQGVTLFANNNFDCEWFFGLATTTRTKIGCIMGGVNTAGVQTAVCQGDSGGPHLVGGLLWGITSFGPNPCDKPNTPAVVTRVSGQTAWIQTALAQINAGQI
ncbi:hypothetical protein HDU93_009860 [Gonapodya sp. JEL0774]|nr:hypothetical protein HDU93_009860 [Gonapodya sp. JEL0774]